MKTWSEVHPLLVEPFGPTEIKARVQRTSKKKGDDRRYPDGTRGLMVEYIDARNVMERLDSVVGPENWSDTYRTLDAQKVVVECTLTVLGVSHSDAGYPNGGSPDEELYKSAYSDALKRAAVKFGVGRHLYEGDPYWVDVNAYGDPIVKGRAANAPHDPLSADTLASLPEQPWGGESAPSDTVEAPTPQTDHMSQAQQKLIQVLAKERGLTNAQLHELAGVDTLTKLTGGKTGTASAFITLLKTIDKLPTKNGEE